MEQDERQNQTFPQSKREEGKKLVATKSSMFNMPKNTRTPNVFTTAPRPGGYMQTLAPTNLYDTSHVVDALGIRYNPPKPSDRVKLIEGFRNLDAWLEADIGKGKCPADKTKGGAPSQSQAEPESRSKSPGINAKEDDAGWLAGRKGLAENCNYVMSIVISTIMTLAGSPKTKPPDHHLSWTVNFLNSIKDDDNKTPRNILGLKQVMKPFLEDVPKPLLIPDDSSLSRDRTFNTRGESTLRYGKTKGKQPTSSPSEQSQTSSGARNKGGAAEGNKASFDSGSRSPPRRSSWK